MIVASVKFQRDSNTAYLDVRDRIGNTLSHLQEGIAGVRVGVHWSVLLIFGLIALGLAAGRLPEAHPDHAWPVYAGVGVATAVVFFASLLAHELAHVVRRDYLLNLLQTVAEALFFYHPAVWFMAACLRTERMAEAEVAVSPNERRTPRQLRGSSTARVSSSSVYDRLRAMAPRYASAPSCCDVKRSG